jgi:membrane protease YdiL (CAAX protease family)
MDKKTKIDLLLFFLISFGITWSIGALYILIPDRMYQLFGEDVTWSLPFFVAVFSPTISAVIVTLWRGGRDSLKELFRRLIEYRVPFYWILVAVFIYPAIWLVWDVIERSVGLAAPDWSLEAYAVSLPALIFSGYLFLDPGPLGEELGWRGFALPRLLQSFNATAAALILGVIWTIWHLPAFFVAGTSQASLNLFWFILSGTMFSVLITWLFVNVRESVWIAGNIPHLMANASSTAGIYKISAKSSLVLALVATILVLVFGKDLRRRKPV